MVGTLVSTVLGGFLQLFALLLGLFPTVDVESLPIAPPPQVVEVLGYINWFVPIGDLITILTAWVALVLAVNVAYVVIGLVNGARGGK